MALKNMFFVKAAVATLGKGGTAALATTVVLAGGITAAGAVSGAAGPDPSTTTSTTQTTEAPTTTAPAHRMVEVPGLGTIEFTGGDNPQVVAVTTLPGITAGTNTVDGVATVTFFDSTGTATVVTATLEDGKLQVSLEDHILVPVEVPASAPAPAPAPGGTADTSAPDTTEEIAPSTPQTSAPRTAAPRAAAPAAPAPTDPPTTAPAPAPTTPRHHEDHEDHDNEDHGGAPVFEAGDD